MSLSSRKIVIAAVFVAPMLCCFIAIGAFLHVLMSFMQQRQQERTELAQRIEQLALESAEFEGQLERENERAFGLQRQLEEEQRRAEAAEAAGNEADRLGREAAKMEPRRSSRQAQRDGVARNVEALPDVRENHRRLSLSLEDLQAQLAKAEAEHAEHAKRKIDARDKKEEERKKVRVLEISGTRTRHFRKPVFVECSARSAIVQPEGRKLGPHPDTDDQATFLASARKTRYVVFLVRPDGFRCFENYREVVTSANKDPGTSIDFGYRLAALLSNTGLQLVDKHGNESVFDSYWKFESMRPSRSRRLVQSVSMGGQTARFRYTVDGTGEVMIAAAFLSEDGPKARPTHVVRYEHDDQGRLCRVRHSGIPRSQTGREQENDLAMAGR